MSIYIKGMDMPISCVKCLLNSDSKCLIMQSEGYDETNGSERRHNCPLIHVPEHGRLIDADILRNLCDDPYWCVWLSDIDNAPAIIPADKEVE